jgi:voltage-gated potassium channel
MHFSIVMKCDGFMKILMGLKKFGAIIRKIIDSFIRNLPWLFLLAYITIWFCFGLLYKHAANESNGDAFHFNGYVLTQMQAERLKDKLAYDCPLSLLLPLAENFKKEKIYQSFRRPPKGIFTRNAKSISHKEGSYHTFTTERLGEHWLNYFSYIFADRGFNYYTLEPYPDYSDFTFSQFLWSKDLIPDYLNNIQRAEYKKAIENEIRPYKLCFYKGPNLIHCLGCDDPDYEYDTVEKRKKNLSKEDFQPFEEYTIFININWPVVYSIYGIIDGNEYHVGDKLYKEIGRLKTDLSVSMTLVENDTYSKLKETCSWYSEYQLVEFLYFSAITITTLGFGDIVPNSRYVRTLEVV